MRMESGHEMFVRLDLRIEYATDQMECAEILV